MNLKIPSLSRVGKAEPLVRLDCDFMIKSDQLGSIPPLAERACLPWLPAYCNTIPS